MKILLLVPSDLKTGLEDQIQSGMHPRMDYDALKEHLTKGQENHVELIGYSDARTDCHMFVRLVRKLVGLDGALAAIGFLDRGKFDSIFTNGENISIPLGMLFKLCRRRPRHVTIGHRLSAGKKRIFFTLAKVFRQIDVILVYATTQLHFGDKSLGIPSDKIRLIAFHADNCFFRPEAAVSAPQNGTEPELPSKPMICSAGLEWRDYPTLIAAVSVLPHLNVRLAAASPWSKHTNETENRTLPENVEARRYDYIELLSLYRSADIVVVPLYENDFQAGVTTLLEAMAIGKAVIVTQTMGQTDVIVNEVNGLTVPPGDSGALRAAIVRLLADSDLRKRLGSSARRWVEENATLDRWVGAVGDAICDLPHTERSPIGQHVRAS